MRFQEKLQTLMQDRLGRAVAKHVGIHEVTMSSYICGHSVPSLAALRRLADALGCDWAWLANDEMGWPVVPAKRPSFPSPEETAAAEAVAA